MIPTHPATKISELGTDGVDNHSWDSLTSLSVVEAVFSMLLLPSCQPISDVAALQSGTLEVAVSVACMSEDSS